MYYIDRFGKGNNSKAVHAMDAALRAAPQTATNPYRARVAHQAGAQTNGKLWVLITYSPSP
jgi:acyl-ACP thioesterase